MRRQVGSVSRLGPNHYRVTVSAGHHADGSRRRISRTVRGSRHDAESAMSRLLLEASNAPRDTSLTLAEYLDSMWLPWVKEQVRERTYAGYASEVELYLRDSLGRIRLDRLDPYRLDRWLVALPSHLSPNTKLHAYRTLHNALARAVKWRMIPSNPLASVDAPKLESKAPDVLTAKECAEYVRLFRGEPVEPFVLLAIGAGLRRSELAALGWGDLDVKAGTVTVSAGLHQRAGRVFREPPKTDKSARVVHLPSWCASRLKELRGVGPLAPMTPGAITSAYRKKLLDSKLRYVPLKNLRHTHLTQLVESGVPIYDVSRRAGHSNTVITQATYLNPDAANRDEQAARALDHLVPSAIGSQQNGTKHVTRRHSGRRKKATG